MDTSNAGRGGASRETEPAAGTGPVAADQPVVDGRNVSSQELRDEVERLQTVDPREVEELRSQVAETAGELAARLDVPTRVRDTRDRAQVRLRVMLDEVRPYARPLVGAAAAVLVAVLLRRRSRRRRSTR